MGSAGGGNGAWFSSVTAESDCFWIGTTTFACFLGLSGVVGRALSMGLSAIMKESDRKNTPINMKEEFDLKGYPGWDSDSNRESIYQTSSSVKDLYFQVLKFKFCKSSEKRDVGDFR